MHEIRLQIATTILSIVVVASGFFGAYKLMTGINEGAEASQRFRETERDSREFPNRERSDALIDATGRSARAALKRGEGWIWLSIALGTLGTLGIIDSITMAGERNTRAMKKLAASNVQRFGVSAIDH